MNEEAPIWPLFIEGTVSPLEQQYFYVVVPHWTFGRVPLARSTDFHLLTTSMSSFETPISRARVSDVHKKI
eukprot:scaffold240658_cov55-Attheya_sp.AAC.4